MNHSILLFSIQGLVEAVSLLIALPIFAMFYFLIYKFFGIKPFKEHILSNIAIIIVVKSILYVLILCIFIAIQPSQQKIQKKKVIRQQKYQQELDTVSKLIIKNIFINNSPHYDENEVLRIKNSFLYDNNFKLHWDAYFIYFLEDLDSSIIQKTKFLGHNRNDVESEMLGKAVTQEGLNKINKLQNDFVSDHKVFIRNRYYSDKEYIDSLIKWHFYHNGDNDYGLKIFKE